MALLWQKTHRGVQYEVRRAGNTLRLFTNGVFHSQYNPKKFLTHGVWDLLMLPAYFSLPGSIKRVLVMGVGGGAVMHLLQSHIQPQIMVGVELNPMHLNVARRFFALEETDSILVQCDAVAWLRNYRGPAFDMIIDDMFGDENQGFTERAVPLDENWFSLVDKNLSDQGMFIVNIHDLACFKNSAYVKNKKLKSTFPSVFKFTMPHYGNRVLAFLKQDSSVRQLKIHLKTQSDPRLSSTLGNFKFSVSKV